MFADRTNSPLSSDDETHCCTLSNFHFSKVHNDWTRLPRPTRNIIEVKDEDEWARAKLPTTLPPTEDPCPQATDALLARDLNNLSVADREKVFDEIHGVDGVPEVKNDAMSTKQCLAEMDHEIKRINKKNKSAYMKAASKDPIFVVDERFRMKFLMADSMNAKKGAQRFVDFFESKLELFGEDRLTREITMEDFMQNPNDRRAMESGHFQTFRTKDRSGRQIVGKFHGREFDVIPLNSRLRVFFYMLMVASNSETSRQKGIVLLVYFLVGHDYTLGDRIDVWKNSALLGSVPLQIKAFHCCHNDRKVNRLASLGMLAMGAEYRARFRLLEGTLVETTYTMMTFGISPGTVPVKGEEEGDELDRTNHMAWIQSRLMTEGVTPTKGDKNITPSDSDVLFGRGRTCQNHLGNIRLRSIINSHLAAYEKARLLDKTRIAGKTVEMIKESHGRFLKQAGTGWIEVDDFVARDKISHAFRDQRRKSKLEQQKKP